MKIKKFELMIGTNVIDCKEILSVKVKDGKLVLYVIVDDGLDVSHRVDVLDTGSSIEEYHNYHYHYYKYLNTVMLIDEKMAKHIFYRRL